MYYHHIPNASEFNWMMERLAEDAGVKEKAQKPQQNPSTMNHRSVRLNRTDYGLEEPNDQYEYTRAFHVA